MSTVTNDRLEIIDLANLIGPNDSKRLLAACSFAYRNSLPSTKYRECYHSPSRPTLSDIGKKHSDNDSLAAFKAAQAKWEATHPEEVAKENASRKKWEDNNDKQFRIIYGIAHRNGLFIKWDCCRPDKWTIYKGPTIIAHINCL